MCTENGNPIRNLQACFSVNKTRDLLIFQTPLQRFFFSPHKNKEVWLQFLGALRGGVIDLIQSEQKKNKHIVLPRLSSVITVFFARAVQILANPSNFLYSAVTNYVVLKKHFNLSVVPEFLSLIHSKDVKHE